MKSAFTQLRVNQTEIEIVTKGEENTKYKDFPKAFLRIPFRRPVYGSLSHTQTRTYTLQLIRIDFYSFMSVTGSADNGMTFTCEEHKKLICKKSLIGNR